MTKPALIAQNEALLSFLDELLTDESQAVSTGSAPSEDPEPGHAIPTPGSRAERSVEGDQSGLAQGNPAEVCDEGLSGTGVAGQGERVPIIPHWGTAVFQAMVFKVGELSLAIPLVELVGVVEWRSEQVEQEGVGGLCLGQYRHDGHAVTLIDTAGLIFSGSHHRASPDLTSRSEKLRIILIDNGNIGLLCDEVHEVISLQPAQVNWRSARTRRKWLAGTVMSQLIAVLDTHTTTEILHHELGMWC